MKNLFDLTDRVAVVVGGTSGLGRAVALGLADAGAHVVPTGRRTELVQQVAEECRAKGVRSLALTCDASDRASLDALRDATLQEFGRIDILVNAAGRTFRKPTVEVTEAEWDDLLNTNLSGTLRACQAFYEPLKASDRGRIVNFGSLTSFDAFHEVAAYAASKAAVLSLTKTLGCEWARDGIRVNAIIPGVFVTDINRALLEGTARGRELLLRTPMGRYGETSEIVGAALFLASDAASFITGTSIAVDGGFLASGVNQ